MTQTRAFRIPDLLLFLNKNTKSYCLDNSVRFTTGRSFPGRYFSGLFSLLPSTSMAVSLGDGREACWAGELYFDRSALTAWVDYLMEAPDADNDSLQDMLELFSRQAGGGKMESIAATIDENSWYNRAFRQCGFSVCSSQTIYQTRVPEDVLTSSGNWQRTKFERFDTFDSLSRSQVPPTLYKINRHKNDEKTFGLLDNGEAVAFASVESGTGKFYLEPIFHPETQDPSALIFDLVAQLGIQAGQCVSVRIPACQSWIGSKLLNANWISICNQIIFVKNLTVSMTEKVGLRTFDSTSALLPNIPQTVKNNIKNQETL